MDAELQNRVLLRNIPLFEMEEAFFCCAHRILQRQGFQPDLAYLIGLSGMANEASMCMHD
jgi:hypothetical protein